MPGTGPTEHRQLQRQVGYEERVVALSHTVLHPGAVVVVARRQRRHSRRCRARRGCCGHRGVGPQHRLPSRPSCEGEVRAGIWEGFLEEGGEAEVSALPGGPHGEVPESLTSTMQYHCSAEGGWPEEPWLSALPWPPPEKRGTGCSGGPLGGR